MSYRRLCNRFYSTKIKFQFYCTLMVRYIFNCAKYTVGKFWRSIRLSDGALKTMSSSCDTKCENDVKEAEGSDGQKENETASSDSDGSQHDGSPDSVLSKRYPTRTGVASLAESEGAQIISNDSDVSTTKNSVASESCQQSLATTSTKLCPSRGHVDSKRILGKESVGTRDLQHQQASFFSLWSSSGKEHKTREQVTKEEKG
jgi:hypothetical protein